MARFFALEWDAAEARVVVARSWGSDAIVEHAFSVPLEDGDGDLGAIIQREVADLNIARCDTLVALGRSSTELRLMQLPPAPVDELPDMVRLQAMREFANIGDEWPLDFVHVDAAHDETLNVLAATISPQMVKKLTSDCMEFDQTPSRIVLRPFAAASLLRRNDHIKTNECRLVVDLLEQEADISVLSDGRVAVMRTVRLPSSDDSEVISRAVMGEIRRTIPAAQNQLGGRRAEHVTILGSGEMHQQLQKMIVDALSLDVELFDPFDAIGSEPSARDVRPEHPGRYASLLGMICDEAAGDAHAFDFLNPRKRREPPKYDVQKLSLVGGLAAVIVLALGYYFWTVSALKSEIAALKKDNGSQRKKVDAAKQDMKDLKTIRKFSDTDVTWLDNLRLLALGLPSADDAILTTVVGSTGANSGGQLIIDGYLKRPEDAFAMEEKLRQFFESDIYGDRVIENPNRPEYKHQVSARIQVGAETVPIQKKDTKGKSGKKSKAKSKASPKGKSPQKSSDKTTPRPEAKKKPEVKQPEAKQPEAKKPEAKTPEAKKPEGKQPEGKQPEGKKPEGKKQPEGKKSPVKKKTASTPAEKDGGKKS